MKNATGTIFGLILIACAGLLIALSLSPEQQSKAQIAVLNAQRDDQARAIKQQYDQARANIQADALAKLELERTQAVQSMELDKAKAQIEFEKKRQLDKLETEFQQAMAKVQQDIDTTRAQAMMQVVIWLSIGVGGALFFILVGRGIGSGISAWARNRGEIVRPDSQTGKLPAIVRADLIALPDRMTGSYMVVRRPSALERIIISVGTSVGTAIAISRGKPVSDSGPWVQIPEPSEAQLQVTARDQAHGLLTAATRDGKNAEVAEKAVQRVFQANVGTLDSRLPTTQRMLSAAELDRITARLDEEE